jgi:hypothetical protein
MTNYVQAIMHLVPDALISYTGVEPDYDSIEWLDERAKPSREDCEAIWPQAEYEAEFARVIEQRRRRYQIETDGLFFDAQRNETSLQPWTDAVDAIKAQLPYPTAP